MSRGEFVEFGLGRRRSDPPPSPAVHLLEDRITPSGLKFDQGQQAGFAYLIGTLQYQSGVMAGAFRTHVNPGIIPNTTQQAWEVDSWRTVETARELVESRFRPAEAIPAAARAARWFLSAREPDGGPPQRHWVDATGGLVAKTTVDAADSANAAFLRLVATLRAVAPAHPDVTTFLADHRQAIFDVGYNLATLVDPTDGLTWTFPPANDPTYKMKLLAGNSESYAGFRDLADLAARHYGDTAQATYYRLFAEATRAAILRELHVPNQPGQFRIAKDHNGVYTELSATPNWDVHDRYVLYPILTGVVSPHTKAALNAVRFLLDRHPDVLTAKPKTALTFTPEFGVALAMTGFRVEAARYARTVLDGVFPQLNATPDGYFTNNDVATLVRLLWIAR
jgi:hypothetical protein